MRPYRPSAVVLAAAASIVLGACSRDTSTLEPAAFPTDGAVFGESFAAGVGFQAFGGSKTDALSIDATTSHSGTTSLKVIVPAAGDASGGYAGGAFVASVPRDLSSYNALSFWVKASRSATMNAIGLGNDNTGKSKFTAERAAVPLTTGWTKVVMPIPLAEKLTSEKGMFYFAEGPEDGAGYTIWLDDIKFEKLASVTNVRPAIVSATLNAEIGASTNIGGTSVVFNVDGADQTIGASPNYFTFTSSNPAVATVSSTGGITVVGAGTSNIGAKLGTVAASGIVVLKSAAAPTVAAPTPTRAAADVISLFSGAYTNVPVDTWSASFDIADVADVLIAGNATKKYTNMAYAGIEFITQKVNASGMTHLHLDVWTYDDAAFKVKLVDFGNNGVFGGNDDSEQELTFTKSSTPGVTAGAWSSLDIPMSSFGGLASTAHLAQIIISGSSPTVYLDNVYFYKGAAAPGAAAPTVAAPTPTLAAANVISLFSNAYTNVPVDNWSADWDSADQSDIQIAGNATKKYTNLVFAGIEFISKQIDASAMTTLHLDLWTPDSTKAPAIFKVKLVDFGTNGAFGGGDDSEHEITINRANTPAFQSGSWMSLDLPLSTFTNLTAKGHLAQIILSGDLRTVFVDNIYFAKGGSTGGGGPAPAAPTTAAPVPTYPAANVLSLFSNAYTNNTVDTWSADWDSADQAEVQIAGDATKRYTNLVFAGIEFITKQLNATSMTNLRMDIWTPDATAAPAIFKIKLVDFGANGAFGGGDDVEHEITLSAATTPALATGNWVTLDIPLTAFTGLVTKGHLAQLIISGDLKTVYVDNVLLHK